MQRPEPTIDERSAAFWTGGADGELRIARCRACGRWLHPPKPVCPSCRGQDIGREAVSGVGTVWSFTVNRYAWAPGMTPPYLIAQIELAEQPGLHLISSVVGTDDVRIGMPVHVEFERAGDAWIPVFAP